MAKSILTGMPRIQYLSLTTPTFMETYVIPPDGDPKTSLSFIRGSARSFKGGLAIVIPAGGKPTAYFGGERITIKRRNELIDQHLALLSPEQLRDLAKKALQQGVSPR